MAENEYVVLGIFTHGASNYSKSTPPEIITPDMQTFTGGNVYYINASPYGIDVYQHPDQQQRVALMLYTKLRPIMERNFSIRSASDPESQKTKMREILEKTVEKIKEIGGFRIDRRFVSLENPEMTTCPDEDCLQIQINQPLMNKIYSQDTGRDAHHYNTVYPFGDIVVFATNNELLKQFQNNQHAYPIWWHDYTQTPPTPLPRINLEYLISVLQNFNPKLNIIIFDFACSGIPEDERSSVRIAGLKISAALAAAAAAAARGKYRTKSRKKHKKHKNKKTKIQKNKKTKTQKYKKSKY